MGCASCFIQMAKNAERQRKERKERMGSFKTNRNGRKTNRELRRIKITGEDKQKLLERIAEGPY